MFMCFHVYASLYVCVCMAYLSTQIVPWFFDFSLYQYKCPMHRTAYGMLATAANHWTVCSVPVAGHWAVCSVFAAGHWAVGSVSISCHWLDVHGW